MSPGQGARVESAIEFVMPGGGIFDFAFLREPDNLRGFFSIGQDVERYGGKGSVVCGLSFYNGDTAEEFRAVFRFKLRFCRQREVQLAVIIKGFEAVDNGTSLDGDQACVGLYVGVGFDAIDGHSEVQFEGIIFLPLSLDGDIAFVKSELFELGSVELQLGLSAPAWDSEVY